MSIFFIEKNIGNGSNIQLWYEFYIWNEKLIVSFQGYFLYMWTKVVVYEIIGEILIGFGFSVCPYRTSRTLPTCGFSFVM